MLKKIDPQGIRRRMTRHFGKILSIFEELIEDRLAMRRSVHDDVLEVCLKISQDNPEELNRSRIKFLMLVSKLLRLYTYIEYIQEVSSY
ncbi:putative geraniol 8-hydroxylase [Helianthus anomalus]